MLTVQGINGGSAGIADRHAVEEPTYSRQCGWCPLLKTTTAFGAYSGTISMQCNMVEHGVYFTVVVQRMCPTPVLKACVLVALVHWEWVRDMAGNQVACTVRVHSRKQRQKRICMASFTTVGMRPNEHTSGSYTLRPVCIVQGTSGESAGVADDHTTETLREV